MMLRTLLLGVAAMLSVPALAAPTAGPTGVWRNAANTVHIRTTHCGGGGANGGGLCGAVIWASDRAKADVAAAGGTLGGAELFRDMADQGDGSWTGEVYVPDLNRSVSGTLMQTGPNTLVAEGCLFAGFGCKQQTWTRVAR